MRLINEKVKLPPGYHVDWAGEYESAKRAQARLAVIVPLTILIIFIILYTMFRSAKWALLILGVVSIAPMGGLLALLATGTYFSVSSGIGFLALFGVSVQTGVIMLEYINQRRARGHADRGRRHRGRRPPAASHHDDDAGGDVWPGPGGAVARDRFGFAAAVRDRHCRRLDGRPGLEHLHPADAVRLGRAGQRRVARARTGG